MLRRFGFFILTNLLVIITISVTLSLFGFQGYLSAQGINYQQLMIFCLVWGMAGSFISLLMSRFMAKWMTKAQVIDPKNPGQMGWLVEMTHSCARNAKLPMPEVAVYPSPEVNAFATGPSKSRSLVAVSEGLLRTMNRDEIEGVIAHEVAHIKNGDMVTMTLIQGVVNAFAMFLSRIAAFFISQALSSDRDGDGIGDGNGMVFFACRLLFDIFFTILGSIVVASFSRQREFRADAGSARILGSKDKMVAALQALQRISQPEVPQQAAIAALKISGGPAWMKLFSTHPPLEERIEALKRA